MSQAFAITDMRGNDRCHPRQRGVTGQVAVGVVDLLEVIDVEQQEGQQIGRASCRERV